MLNYGGPGDGQLTGNKQPESESACKPFFAKMVKPTKVADTVAHLLFNLRAPGLSASLSSAIDSRELKDPEDMASSWDDETVADWCLLKCYLFG